MPTIILEPQKTANSYDFTDNSTGALVNLFRANSVEIMREMELDVSSLKWCQTSVWEAWEQEADADLQEGRYAVFDSVEELLQDLLNSEDKA